MSRAYRRGLRKYAALRGSSVQGQYKRGGVTHSHHLGSACQEVQDPVTEKGVKTPDPELANELSGNSCVEC